MFLLKVRHFQYNIECPAGHSVLYCRVSCVHSIIVRDVRLQINDVHIWSVLRKVSKKFVKPIEDYASLYSSVAAAFSSAQNSTMMLSGPASAGRHRRPMFPDCEEKRLTFITMTSGSRLGKARRL